MSQHILSFSKLMLKLTLAIGATASLAVVLWIVSALVAIGGGG